MSEMVDETRLNTGPKKFVVWLFIVASIMLFAGLTSGYIVKKGAGNWLEYRLPSLFLYNTLVILLSSFTLYWALYSARKLQFDKERIGLYITLILGVVFLVGQWKAWVYLTKGGVVFSGNPSGSFLYVISGLHGLHIVAGLGLILSAIQGASGKFTPSVNLFRLEMASIFWHFLDILWIFLYVFLLLNQ